MVSHMACQQRCTHFQEIAALVRGLARDNDGLHNPLNKAGSFLGGVAVPFDSHENSTFC